MTLLLGALHATLVAALFVYVGHAGAVRAELERGSLLRWTAACVLAPAAAIAIFNGLSTAGLYSATSATMALAALAAALRLAPSRNGPPRIAALLEQDRHALARLLRPALRGVSGAVAVGFGLAASLTIAHAIVAPPLAWDTLTYHAVKAAMWLQAGGALPLEAPGGWSTHVGRLGGADVLTSWTLLAGRGDALFGTADVFGWLGIALGLLGLSRELGLRVRDRLAVTLYACFVPATLLAVGSGYAELAVTAMMALALALLSHALRTGHTGAWAVGVVAIGTLMSMKLIVWPGVAVLALFAVDIARRLEPGTGPRLAPTVAFAATGAALVALPGLVRNAHATGYPLSVPLRLGPFVLGPPNAELDHLEATFSPLVDHGLAAELAALTDSFGDPLRFDPQLTVTAVPLVLLACIGLGREMARGGAARTRAIWITAALGAVLASWFSPALETVRLHWARANPRHLLVVVLPLLPFAFAALRGAPKAAAALRIGLVAAAALHAGLCIAVLAAAGAYADVQTPAAVIFFALFVSPLATASRRRARGLGPLAPAHFVPLALATTVALAAVAHVAGDTRTEQRFAGPSLLGDVPRYWLPAAALTDDPGQPFVVAVTSGVEPAADNWFMYPFLGSNHQNRLVYARLTEGEPMPPLAPGHGRTERARLDVWLRNLDALEADWVMAFHPAALELTWMNARPARFERHAGDGRSWGLYRVRRGLEGARPAGSPR